jgi:hypothetical protein
MNASYSSLAIYEVKSHQAAISTLSVTNEECVLSGGWVIPITNSDEIKNILTDKLTIPVSMNTETKKLEKDLGLKSVSFTDFFKEAALESKIAAEQYEAFKAENPGKRKKLVAPDFYVWPEDIDVLQPKVELKRLNLRESISGTAPAMEQVLSAARLVKFFVDKWLSDESERSNRKFVHGEAKQATPLPTSWKL